MPRFSVRWLEIAIEYYDALPAATRQQIDARVEQLLEWPEGPPEAYDARRDRWTTTYGDGAGLILYAVAEFDSRAVRSTTEAARHSMGERELRRAG